MNEASIPNKALDPLTLLVGEWKTVGTHGDPEWHRRVRERRRERHAVRALFDERGVSRKYDVSFRDDTLKWWRDAPGFSQRVTGRPYAARRTRPRRTD